MSSLEMNTLTNNEMAGKFLSSVFSLLLLFFSRTFRLFCFHYFLYLPYYKPFFFACSTISLVLVRVFKWPFLLCNNAWATHKFPENGKMMEIDFLDSHFRIQFMYREAFETKSNSKRKCFICSVNGLDFFSFFALKANGRFVCVY